MAERRYTEEEVALILRRAVESTPTDYAGPDAHGVTLAQLKQIAGEVGIDTTRIERAARSLDRPTGTIRRALGLPTTFRLVRVVDVELTEADLPRMITIIREVLARQGIVEDVLGGLEWRARGAMGGQYVTIRPVSGGTQIEVLGNFRDGMFATVTTTGAVGAIAGIMAGSVFALPAVAAATLALGGAASGVLPWRAFFPRSTRALTEVADRLEHYLLAGAETGPDEDR